MPAQVQPELPYSKEMVLIARTVGVAMPRVSIAVIQHEDGFHEAIVG